MMGYRAPAPVVLAIALACLFVGGRSCATDATPQLVRVIEVTPREVELGERITVIGDGFPAGRAARVTFRGALYRPGERPVRGAEIGVPGTVVDPNRLEIPFDEATQALFAGAGDRAIHTTFEGDVEVAFAAAAPGAPPIAGTLARVQIDVRPSASASQTDREQEGGRALAWIGMQTTACASGLIVDTVRPGSRAYAAGIAAGDIVTSFDGVRVSSSADVLPTQHEATIGVRNVRDLSSAISRPQGRRIDDNESIHVISMDGFRRAAQAELLWPSLIVIASLAAAWIFGAPSRPRVAAALQRAVSRMRIRIAGTGHTAMTARVPLRSCLTDARTLLRGLSDGAGDAPLPRRAQALVDALACALVAVIPVGQYVVAARLDVGLVFLCAITALVVAAFVAQPLPWNGLRAAGRVAWQHVPASAAVASVVVMAGSLRLQEIERAEGGWPWEWLAFRSPAGLVACSMLLSCSRIDVSPHEQTFAGLSALMEDGDSSATRSDGWIHAVSRAHRLVVAGLVSALFLGGWLLPGISPVEQGSRTDLELAGITVFVAKTWFLVLLVAWSHWLLPRWRGRRTRATLLWLAPLS
ncbi:MAG: NADH-quinone oxidoreductase subunit H, partial [Myxococcota bacterium]|nr:NADH-quinone oxidoreductase subunit H [Myxococcota bacterium]